MSSSHSLGRERGLPAGRRGRPARYLLHDDLLVRFPALLVADAAVLVAAWTLGYLLLPEGFLAGRTGAVSGRPGWSKVSDGEGSIPSRSITRRER